MTKIRARVAFIQYYEIELDTDDYEPDTDLAEVIRDYEIWPSTPADGDVGAIYVLRPDHDSALPWWEEINDDTVGRLMRGEARPWFVFGDGGKEHKFATEDEAIRTLGVTE